MTGRPPARERICKRLSILWANTYRAFMESESHNSADWQAECAELEDWLSHIASDELTARERERHQKQPGTWDMKTCIQDSWDKAAAIPLLWAVGVLQELPPFDLSVAWEDADVPTEAFPDFFTLSAAKPLRQSDEFDASAAACETVYWRLRINVESDSDLAYTKKLLFRAAQLKHVTLANDGDLVLSTGKSASLASPEELSHARSVAMERLYGLNWLCGQEEDWDLVTADSIVEWLWDENWPAAQ